jgi:predicted secreted protein
LTNHNKNAIIKVCLSAKTRNSTLYDGNNDMENAIKESIEYLKKVPQEFQAIAFPLIFEHQLLEIRREAWVDKKRK